jgi:hypothetical protein
MTGFLLADRSGFFVTAQAREMYKHASHMHVIANSPKRQ